MPASDDASAFATQGYKGLRVAWLIFLLACVIFAQSGWIPWRVDYISGTLDPSWLLALKWAHVHDIDFGSALVFTHGPWGFALLGYDAATFASVVGVWSFFATTFCFGVFVLGRQARPPLWAAAIWISLIVIFTSADITQDVRMFSLSWLLILIHFIACGRWGTIAKYLLLIAVALAGLVKFSMTLMAISAVALIAVHRITAMCMNRDKTAQCRAMALELSIFIAAYVGFWLLSGQYLAALPSFLRHSMEISNAYARAEQTSTPDEFASVAYFLLCAVPLVGVVFFALRKRKLEACFAAIGVALCIFMAFKAGFVRHDAHELHATTGLAILALLWSFALWPSMSRIGKTFAVIVVAASLNLCSHSLTQYEYPNLPRDLIAAITDFPARSGTALSWMAGHFNMRESSESHLRATLLGASNLPVIHGTVDIYPWGQGQLLLRGFDYDPRPVIDSYVAYTPALAELNADFLRSAQAPEWILFNIATIDDRYPAFDDGLSWPELLTRYDFAGMSDNLLLHRATNPRSYQIIPGAAQSAAMGDSIPVPNSDDLIWARIDVRQTAVGKLTETLYKATPITMSVTTADGITRQFRFLPDVARSGFLLSPCVRDKNEFASLNSSQWKSDLLGQTVISIKITASGENGSGLSYDPTVRFSFDRLEFSALPLSK